MLLAAVLVHITNCAFGGRRTCNMGNEQSAMWSMLACMQELAFAQRGQLPPPHNAHLHLEEEGRVQVSSLARYEHACMGHRTS